MLQRAHRGRAATEHRQAGVPALVTCYGLRQPVQKIVGTKVVQQGRRCRSDGGERCGSAVKSTQGSSRLQDHTDQLKAVLRKRHGDQGGSGVAGGEELLGNGFTCTGGFE